MQDSCKTKQLSTKLGTGSYSSDSCAQTPLCSSAWISRVLQTACNCSSTRKVLVGLERYLSHNLASLAVWQSSACEFRPLAGNPTGGFAAIATVSGANASHLWARTTLFHSVAVSNTAAVTVEACCLHLSETADRSAAIAAVRQDV